MIIFCHLVDMFGGFGSTLGVWFRALTPPGAVSVGQLSDRGNAFGVAFRPILGGHGTEQAQVVTTDGDAATSGLEVANGAMPIQDEGWWFPAAIARIESMIWRVRAAKSPILTVLWR